VHLAPDVRSVSVPAYRRGLGYGTKGLIGLPDPSGLCHARPRCDRPSLRSGTV